MHESGICNRPFVGLPAFSMLAVLQHFKTCHQPTQASQYQSVPHMQNAQTQVHTHRPPHTHTPTHTHTHTPTHTHGHMHTDTDTLARQSSLIRWMLFVLMSTPSFFQQHLFSRDASRRPSTLPRHLGSFIGRNSEMCIIVHPCPCSVATRISCTGSLHKTLAELLQINCRTCAEPSQSILNFAC